MKEAMGWLAGIVAAWCALAIGYWVLRFLYEEWNCWRAVRRANRFYKRARDPWWFE